MLPGVSLRRLVAFPPLWIRTIPGAEARALFMAARHALPGTAFRPDCLPNVTAYQRGRRWATAAARPLARVWNLIFTALDDADGAADVAWMPAHTSSADVGRARLSNGALLTQVDRMANAGADAHARTAAATHRVPESVRNALQADSEGVFALGR